MKQQLLKSLCIICSLCTFIVVVSCASYEKKQVDKGSVLDFMQQVGLERLEPQQIHRDDVVSIDFSPNGNFLVSGSKDSTIKIWDLQGYTIIRSLKGHSSAISQVLYSPNGEFIASVSVDGTIIVWDMNERGSLYTELNYQQQNDGKQQSNIYAVAFHPYKNMLISAGKDGYIRIWDIEKAQAIKEIKTQQIINSIAYSPDGSYFVSGGTDNIVRFWDLQSDLAKENANKYPLQGFRRHYGDINALAFSSDGKYLASASDDCTIIVYSLDDLAKAKTHEEGKQASYVLKGHASNVYAINFSADSQYIISSSADESIKIWNVKKLVLERSIKDNHDRIWTVAFGEKKNIIASAGKDTRIKLWSLNGSSITMLRERLEIATIYDNTMFTVTQLKQEHSIIPQPILTKWKKYKLDKIIVDHNKYFISKATF